MDIMFQHKSSSGRSCDESIKLIRFFENQNRELKPPKVKPRIDLVSTLFTLEPPLKQSW